MRIEGRSVRRRYGTFEALRGLDFTLESGTRTALVGPNGSGKTTLLRGLMGMLRVEGSLLLDGADAWRRGALRAGELAYVPQIAPDLACPVGELVGSVARLRGGDPRDAVQAAAELGLDLGEHWAKPFRKLSGGNRQRCLASLALAFPARLYLLDEPTAALDPEARSRFFGRFARASRGATVLLSSHRWEELVELTDRVLVLREGRLYREGPLGAASGLVPSGSPVGTSSLGACGGAGEVAPENPHPSEEPAAMPFSPRTGIPRSRAPRWDAGRFGHGA